MEFLTKSSYQTKKVGELLASELLKKVKGEKRRWFSLSKKILKAEPLKGALIIGLEGELGSGKTTFLQGFAKGLKIKEKILSPTFIIIKNYKIKNIKLKIKNFFHIDCYRIEKTREILKLGFKEIVSNPQNVIAIEWAEKIKKILPKEVIWTKFEFVSKTNRRIVLK